METMKLLKSLTELNGVPGQEGEVKKYMEKLGKSYQAEVSYDNIGSVILKKSGLSDGPRIAIAGHMDEVGFMVSRITKDGFIRFIPLGGWYSQVLLAHEVEITTKKGKVLGVIGSKPPHILSDEDRQKPVSIDSMFIDIGVKNKEEAVGLGITVGDMITPVTKFSMLGNGNYLMAKAWDNRIGCAVVLEVLNNLQNLKHPNNYYGIGTVQEEVGCRGAKTTANMINPDIAISVDVGIANDIPAGESDALNDCHGMEMGKGPQILLSDSGLIGHRALREFVISVAEELKIPYQITFLKRGGTDAGPMSLAHDGCPSMSLCIPSRYIHSHTSMIHKEDYLNTVKLVTALIERLDKKTVNAITYN
ncbi:MAG: M42 family metallopeptidase [Erysipelotrichales bacterium]|nr:M42 family metallopeptidase [Erysipelotrichales bacterium]